MTPAARAAATRYAGALLSLAQETGVLDPVASDLDALHGLIESCPEFRAFLSDTAGSDARRRAAIDALFATRVNPLTRTFIRFLETKRRTAILPRICVRFSDLVRRHRGIERVALTVASPLPPGRLDALRSLLETRTGKRIEWSVSVDARLLGGFAYRIGDRLYDHSAAGALAAIGSAMRGAAGRSSTEEPRKTRPCQRI